MVKRSERQAVHRALQLGGHFAWRTCIDCPQPYKGRWDEGLVIDEVICTGLKTRQIETRYVGLATKRCRPCNRENHRFVRFRNWFDDLRNWQMIRGLKISLVTITRSTKELRGASPEDVMKRGMEELRDMKRKASRMIRENPKWKRAFEGGLIVGEMKFRRPREFVKDRRTGEILRVCSEYEAHPHIHAVMLHEKKLKYKELISASQKGSFNSVWFDADVSVNVAEKYLRGYLSKDDPRLNDKTMRCRDKVGLLKETPEKVVPTWVWQAMNTKGVQYSYNWERKVIRPEVKSEYECE